MKKYKTHFLPLASFLYSKKEVNFIDIDRTDPNRVYFLFEPADKALKLADKFFAGKAKTDPLVLFAKYHALKNVIFGGRKQE